MAYKRLKILFQNFFLLSSLWRHCLLLVWLVCKRKSKIYVRNYVRLAEPTKNAAIMLADRWPLAMKKVTLAMKKVYRLSGKWGCTALTLTQWPKNNSTCPGLTSSDSELLARVPSRPAQFAKTNEFLMVWLCCDPYNTDSTLTDL